MVRSTGLQGAALAAVGLAMLSGCATLPSSGPTAAEILKGARKSTPDLLFSVVDVNAAVLKGIEENTAAAHVGRQELASLAAAGRNDTVGPGDVLAISIYEVGVSLFGGARDNAAGYDPSARGENFGSVVVDQQGAVTLPYIGRLLVAGHTPGEIQAMIVRGLSGKSQMPQAIVGVRQNVSNTIYVGGDVRRPGRFELSLQRERLLDAIALGGGSANSSEDTIVRVNRGARTVEERLGRILAGSPDDLRLLPGDRIELIHRPRTFIVMGATGKVSQVPFETGDVSLAEAIARAGGPNDSMADPTAVFLFRYEIQSMGTKPVIYRLNLMQPASLFLSQRISIQDKDVLYIANATANRPAKLVAIINQLFSPLVTARAISR